MRAKSRSNIGMVRILRDMLDMEGADKDFLLTEITRLTHGRDAMFALTKLPAEPQSNASDATIRQRRTGATTTVLMNGAGNRRGSTNGAERSASPSPSNS